MLKIKVVNKGHQPLPQYATPQSAGMDLRANLDEPVTLKPLERKLIPTGLHIALPAGYEAQVRPRSGLALKKGITVLNTPGTIDADYRGEVCVILINLSQEDFVVEDGERIAQMVIARHEQGDFIAVDVFDETERGEGGFGHSGVKSNEKRTIGDRDAAGGAYRLCPANLRSVLSGGNDAEAER